LTRIIEGRDATGSESAEEEGSHSYLSYVHAHISPSDQHSLRPPSPYLSLAKILFFHIGRSIARNTQCNSVNDNMSSF
jgi:hypothetical protein